MPDEREFKLEASPHFNRPDLAVVGEGVTAAEPVQQRLATVYWDTADLRLARWGCSLQHRSGEGWTVKLPPAMEGQMMVRDEHNFPGPASRPPAAAIDILRAFVRSAELEPVAHLQTRRVVVRLTNAEGTELAEVDDDEVSVLDGRRIAARFRQLEVEVKSPNANGVVDTVVSRLRAAGAAPDATPKHERALGPRASAPPEIDPTRPGPDATTAEALRYAIGVSVTRLLKHDAAVRIGGETESVHQARVATRRLRSDLRTFAAAFEPDFVGGLRAELKWIGDSLGSVRDADVLRARVQSHLKAGGGSSTDGRRLVQRLTSRRKTARLHLMQAFRSQRYVDLLDALVAAAVKPPLGDAAEAPAREALIPLAAQPWRKLRKSVKRLGAQPTDAELHYVRIAAKRCRYATEAVTPLVGKPAERFAEALAGLQQTLGDYNDAVIATEWLRAAGLEMRSSTAFMAGALSETERALAAKAKRQWPTAWKKLDKHKMHAWLGLA